jgi:hypothetical protein
MKCLTWILWAMLLAACGAVAQPTAPEVRVEAVDRGSVIYVKNRAAQPLMAFLVELVDYPGSGFFYYQEEAPDGVAQGVERRIPVTSMLVGAAPDYVKVTAAVYLDKSTIGAAVKVARLAAARKATLAGVQEAIRVVEAGRDAAALRQIKGGGRIVAWAAERLEKSSAPDALAYLKRAETALSPAP